MRRPFSPSVAPYCAIPRDYLSDTPLLRAMGFLASLHGQLGAIPPPPFLSISSLETMQGGGAIPHPPKGYLSDTCAIPYESKANGCDCSIIPPLRYYLERVLRDRGGGISHWATKFSPTNLRSSSLHGRSSRELVRLVEVLQKDFAQPHQ